MASIESKLFEKLQDAQRKLGEAQSDYLDGWHELARYRLGLIAEGKEPEVDVALLPKAPPTLVPADQFRREMLARENAEADRLVRSDPRTSSLFAR
jgi:hypothetical protein